MRTPTVTLFAMLGSTTLAACFLTQSSSGSDAGADGAAAATSTATAGTTTADAGLSNCATDPITKVTLCTSVAACPSLSINHDVFPDCGYRAVGGSFDIQCWCSGYVCPLGSPTSCADVEQLFEQQSEALVCTQVDQGRCTQPQKTGSTTGGTTTTACQACMQQCGNTPGCKDVCGC